MPLLLNLLFLFSLAFGVLLPREEKVVGSVLPNFEMQREDGSLKSLKELAQGKPLIINPIYTKCSSACPLMTQQLKRSLGNLDAVVLSLSFDPSDTPEDLRRFKDIHKLPKNWFVAKAGEEVFRALDFNYTYNGEFKEFDHPNVFYVLSPSLKVSRVFYGLSPSPRSLELATLEAKKEEVGLGITSHMAASQPQLRSRNMRNTPIKRSIRVNVPGASKPCPSLAGGGGSAILSCISWGPLTGSPKNTERTTMRIHIRAPITAVIPPRAKSTQKKSVARCR
jgi:protein SCO1/2